ncbi:MAG TPA: hypothetical protein VJ780_04795 [Flavobacterium sp.]|nr:hypothetical protein [Flavobacterium sp.]
MKTIITVLGLFFSAATVSLQAQNTSVQSETKINAAYSNKIAYYEQRGAEDAKYELSFKAKTQDEEKAFWKDKKEYEKNLKKNNRKAYRAYMNSKKEVYTSHHSSCDAHCHHSDYFYGQAGYYYYGYNQPYYQNTPRSTSVKTQIGVRAPSVRLGL